MRLRPASERGSHPCAGPASPFPPTGRSIVAGNERTISEGDAQGNTRWQSAMPDSVVQALPDRLTIDDGVAIVTFKPVSDRPEPLDVDVIAISLDP